MKGQPSNEGQVMLAPFMQLGREDHTRHCILRH